MRGHVLLLSIPSLAMGVVGFAMFGPGAVRPFEGAQLWGGPPDGAGPLTLRVAVIERFRGIDSTYDAGRLTITAETAPANRADHASASANCATRTDGTCEVELALGGAAIDDVRATV